MIIVNGYIQPIIRKGGGLGDDGGHPVAASEEYGKRIPCQYQATTYNAFSRQAGETIIKQGYSILVEECPLRVGAVRLLDRRCAVIGDFQVISSEPLEAVCQTRLIIR